MSGNKKGKHLQFYMDCMKTGMMPDEGLCFCINKNNMGPLEPSIFDLFIPDEEDKEMLIDDNHSLNYWGSGLDHMKCGYYQFTTLRQTIVLFMAAINNEL